MFRNTEKPVLNLQVGGKDFITIRNVFDTDTEEKPTQQTKRRVSPPPSPKRAPVVFSLEDREALMEQLLGYSKKVNPAKDPLKDVANAQGFEDILNRLPEASLTAGEEKETEISLRINNRNKDPRKDVPLATRLSYVKEMYNLARSGTYAEFKSKWEKCKTGKRFPTSMVRTTPEHTLHTFIEKQLATIAKRPPVSKSSTTNVQKRVSAPLQHRSTSTPQVVPTPQSVPVPVTGMTHEQNIYMLNAKAKLYDYLHHLEQSKKRWFYDASHLNAKIKAVESLVNAKDYGSFRFLQAQKNNIIMQHRSMMLFYCIPVTFSFFGTTTGKTVVNAINKLPEPTTLRR